MVLNFCERPVGRNTRDKTLVPNLLVACTTPLTAVVQRHCPVKVALRLLTRQFSGMTISDSLSNTAPRIRRLSKDDQDTIDRVVHIVNQGYRGRESWTTEADIVAGMRTTRDGVSSVLSSMQILVASVGSDDETELVIGCVETGSVTETVVGPIEGTEPSFYLGMLAVDPVYQSSGVGRALCEEVFRCAREEGKATRVVMDVLSCRTELIAWYERMGFRPTGHRKDARSFMDAKGETLLKDCDFILLEKKL